MAISNLAKLVIKYDDSKLIDLREKIIPTLGSNVVYYDIRWICDKKKRNPSDLQNRYTIYFSCISPKYIELVKDFCIISFQNNENIGGIQSIVKRIKVFLSFIDNKDIELSRLNKSVVQGFRKYLENGKYTSLHNKERQYAQSSKNKIWSAVNKFLAIISELNGAPDRNYFAGRNPYPIESVKHDNKYVPKYVIKQFDKAFKDEEIPFYMRLIYWIARSIPSRIGEVLAMNIECLKPLDDETWVIFIPTFKQNGGYKEAQIRRVYLKKKGHGKFLIDTIEMQKSMSYNIQDELKEDEKGLLFAHKVIKNRNGIVYENKKPIVTKYCTVWETFKGITEKNDIRDENGKLYYFTSHQLRHNGITDRLYSGFSYIQVSLITEHQGLAMIENSYEHIQQDAIIDVQKKVIEYDDNVYFKGKILNMDEATEKRLLQNITSRSIKDLGICRDFSGCNAFQCLDDCKNFIPDADNLTYFKEQVRIFEEKLIKVGAYPYLKENIEYNLELYRKVIDKINRALLTEEIQNA